MTRSLDKLPDFSKGESFATRQHPEFEPLFCQPVGEQIRIEESLIEPSMADTELGQLMSELDQLGCDVEEAAQVAEVVPAEETLPPVEGVSEAEHQAALQELQDQHAAEMEALRDQHASNVVEQLERMQQQMIDAAASQVEAALAEALQTLFQNQITHNNIEQLVTEVQGLIARDSVDRIKLVGPDQLIAPVSQALIGGDYHIDVEPADTSDIVVQLNDQILSTRIGDWVRRLEKVLET